MKWKQNFRGKENFEIWYDTNPISWNKKKSNEKKVEKDFFQW